MIYLVYILIGIIVGISMGVTGIGAGILTIALLSLIGVNIKTSIGVCMVMQLLPQSIIGVYNYRDSIDWLMSIIVTLSSVIGIGIGSYVVSRGYLSELLVYRIITVFMVITSVYFVYRYF